VIAVAATAVAVVTAQAGDLVTFLRMIVEEGLQAEANPLIAHGVSSLGLPAIILAKVALMVFVVTCFAILSRALRRTAAVGATPAVVAGILGTFTNVMAVI
jgi:hypothetical protein